MQGLILLFSLLQCSLISDVPLEGSFLPLLLPHAKIIRRHHWWRRTWCALEIAVKMVQSP